MKLLLPVVAALAAVGTPATASAAGFSGADLSLIWIAPFVGILLSIAICPLVAPRFWHHHFGKVSAFWAIAFLGPFAAIHGFGVALEEVLHVLLLEYIPFIILLFSLYTVAGGVRVRGALVGTPAMNVAMLAFGTGIASFMGTTGAAMLMIRPVIRANAHRRSQVHVIVFFIFLVANIGGSLTPLGDPPLFLGFLKGVSFFWPMTQMIFPMLVCVAILLAMFFLLDSVIYKREGAPKPEAPAEPERFGLDGKINLLLLGGVVCAVLMSGVWKPGVAIPVGGFSVELQNIARDVLLIGIALLSLKLTATEYRKANDFNWFPILEVAKLFAGIFLTIVPAIAILKAGESGALGWLIALVSSPDGTPRDVAYFWLTGGLSSFLDNAPTYVVFFNAAGGDAQTLMGPLASTLLAISCGAVFMGANTYIGNAPNFMVRAIAEDRGVPMPSFFGFMLWSSLILLPIFGIVTLLFFA